MERCLTNEQRILILMSRILLTKNNIEKLKSLFLEKIDWDSIIIQAIDHKILGLVWNHLKALKATKFISKQMQLVIQYYTTGIKYRDRVYMTELDHVVCAAGAAGIPVAPLKGAYLIPNVWVCKQICVNQFLLNLKINNQDPNFGINIITNVVL